MITARGWPVALVVPVLVLAWLAVSCASESGKGAATAGPRWTNSLGQVFVPVPGTTVQFCIWETRVKDFAVFAATGAKLDGTNWNNAFYHAATPVSVGPEYPVVNVSWNDAEAFCAWLTRVERASGKISAGQRYRLPTDDEWSVAVGIGGRETGSTPHEKSGKLAGVYPWGTQWPPPAGSGNFADQTALDYFKEWPHIEGYNDGYVTTAPVGTFQPNALGIYDLAGNAEEWCGDYYDGTHQARVLRGGAWNNCGPHSLLSSYREHVAPDRCSVVTGFRCVLETGKF